MPAVKMWRYAGALAAATVLAVSGCAKNTEDGGAPSSATTAASASRVDDIASSVPEDIKSSGKLIVGTDPSYPPNEYRDPSGKIIGFDVELMNAIAATLGLTPDYRPSAFEKIIPSIQGGGFNVGMSSFTDTKERERQVDFVTYFSAGSQWAAPTDKPVDPENACGKKVAVQATTVQETIEMVGRNEKCAAAGQPPINVVKFDDQTAATNAVVLGQADAVSADSPVVAYAVARSAGKLATTSPIFASAPYGWAVRQGSPLTQSLRLALEHLIKTGAYKQIASNWAAESGTIDKPVINGAIN